MPDDGSYDLLYEVQEIRKHIERMDKRDRMRTIGGFIKGVIALIPLILFLYSAWYFYNNWEELLDTVSSKAAENAAKASGALIDNGFVDSIKESVSNAIRDNMPESPNIDQIMQEQLQKQQAAEQ